LLLQWLFKTDYSTYYSLCTFDLELDSSPTFIIKENYSQVAVMRRCERARQRASKGEGERERDWGWEGWRRGPFHTKFFMTRNPSTY